MRVFRRWLLLVSVGAQFLAGGLGQGQGDVAGKMISVQGTVEIDISGWTPAQIDQLVNAGNTVRTAERSRATVLLLDETQLKIAPSSQLQLTQVRQSSSLLSRLAAVSSNVDQSVLNVSRGKAWLRSRKKPAAVAVETPAVTAAIRGTEFVIEVRPDGETIATVLEGTVDLSNPQGSIQVNSGEEGRARIGEAPTKRVIVNPQDAVQWTLYYAASASPRDYPFVTANPAAARAQLQTPPQNPLALAQLQHDAGELQAALGTLQGVAGGEAAEARGWILLELNRIADAVSEFEGVASPTWRGVVGLSIANWKAGDLQTAYRTVENQTSPQAQVLKSTYLLLAGEVQEARQILESVRQVDATNAQAQGLLALVQLVQNDKDAALTSAREAVQANADSPSARLNLSLVQQSFFDLPAATRSARDALALDPNFVSAQVQLAKLLFGAGRTGAAQKLAQQTVRLAPDDADVQSLLGFIFLARAKTDQALQSFQRSIQLESGVAEPRLGLGIAYMRQGLYDQAITEILSAAALEPRLALYQSYLGKAFYEKRDFEQAFTALASAMELDPRDPTPYLYSGIFQNDLNRPGEAVKSFQTSIRLNDNRAVYRSQFVLDQDRSTRNVQLATAFNRLGLSNWANVEAVRSNLDDPTNSASHLFLAGTFLNLPGRTGAAGSELLLTRLLMPVNANSFNAFNDYTTLYERPRLNFTTAGTYGSFDATSGSLIASGGGKRWAYGMNFTYDREQGFRNVNGDTRNYTSFALFKYALSPHSDILLSLTNQQSNSGDRSGAIIQADDVPTEPFPEDPDSIFYEGTEEFRFPRSNGIVPFLSTSDGRQPNLRITNRLDRFEAGFHHRFRPGSDLVVLFSSHLRRQALDRFFQLSAFGRPLFPGSEETVPVSLQLGKVRSSLRLPTFTLQASHLLKIDRYSLKYGVDILKGRSRQRDNDTEWDDCRSVFFFQQACTGDYTDGGQLGPGFIEGSSRVAGAVLPSLFFFRKDVDSGTAFAQGEVTVGPFVFDGGVNYDWASDDNVFVGPESRLDTMGTRGVDRKIHQWNPQGGVLFRPGGNLIVRFTAARSLQPLTSGIMGGAFVRERVVPTHLNGFLLNLNETELTRSELYEAALDYRWGGHTFFQVDGFFRQKEIPIGNTRTITLGDRSFVLTTPDLFSGDSFGGRASISHLVTEQISIVGQYLLTDDDLPGHTRRDHDLSANLIWVSPSGLSARLKETFFKQNGFLGGSPTDSKVYLTDLELRYELPRKFGLLRFQGQNLFDRRYTYIVDPLALSVRPPERALEVGLLFFF